MTNAERDARMRAVVARYKAGDSDTLDEFIAKQEASTTGVLDPENPNAGQQNDSDELGAFSGAQPNAPREGRGQS